MASSRLLKSRGGLVLRSRVLGQKVPGSKSDSTEDSLFLWACYKLNHTYGSKSPPAVLVRKFGEGVPAQMSSSHLTVIQNFEVRPKYSPHVASKTGR
ncbi:hypothetical protein AVEN_37944-1 [Araneus ventricosus]|uniref:Uncharacterized protein n=1 Tax=Araneus ventricosus TaxID=182803 RepID=A0A4Y2BQ06_ARAVE|nr:hypothetical protein AVEN_96858-1 [Araneus ventricosus]GBL94301.1 hypothetical protein AVEN_37944-1 [Araneus ventricosus]